MAHLLLRDASDLELWLFPNYAVVGFCFIWLGIWMLLLAYLPTGLKTTRTGPAKETAALEEGGGTAPPSNESDDSSSSSSGSGKLDFYVRKLRRMQVYCVIASVVGLLFFAMACMHEDPLPEMLNSFGPVHQVLFTMAIAHWVLNMWEDWETRSFLGQGLKADAMGGAALFPLNLCCSPSGVMMSMYFLHHSFAAIVYAYSLATHKLGGVMVQGFLFEIPVTLMLRRELAHASKDPPTWLRSPAGVNTHWLLQYATFLLGRAPATILWLVSILPGYGSQTLSRMDLGTPTLFMYHLMAIFFTSLNLRIIGLYVCWHTEDDARARKWLQNAKVSEGEGATQAPPSSLGSSPIGHRDVALDAAPPEAALTAAPEALQ